ncbi:MAG: SUMF1/EgtB/PvdO family nonheme iron enzyme [Pseudomonadota bacterium]
MDTHSSVPTLRLLFLLFAGLAGGCGGSVRDSTPPSEDGGTSDAGGGSPPDGAPSNNEPWSGSVHGVPAGDVFVGSWVFDRSIQRFRRPVGCKVEGLTGEDRGANRKLTVGEFRLHEAPVTNGLYAICVSAGTCTPPDHDIADPDPSSWDSPGRSEVPVYVRHDQAEEYCQWAQGRLPTVAELSRAAQGDAEIPGVAALTQAAIDCAQDTVGSAEQPALCEQLQLMNYFQTPSPPLYRTNGFELDRGPYGHVDLFGSVWEWTQTWGGFAEDGHFCALPDGSPDFVTFDPDHERNQSDVLGFASVLMEAIANSSVYSICAFPTRIEQNPANRYNIGFRCAFDNAR